MEVRFNLVAPEALLGALKATGSTDRDVLYAAKEEFAARYRPLRWFGIWGLVCGVLCTALVILAFIGIPLFFLGLWWLRRAKRNAATIEETYAAYLGQVAGQAAPGAAPAMRAMGLALLTLHALAAPAAAQNDVVPAEWVGEYGPGGKCAGPMKLVLAERQMTLVNGNDRASHGNVTLAASYFGNSYQGIMLALLPDWDQSQPYVVTLNSGEKKGNLSLEFNDAALRKRFPFTPTTMLRRCAAATGARVGRASAASSAETAS